MNYPILDGDEPFAKEFNKRSGDYWVRTGSTLEPDWLAMNILIDDYNARHSLPVEEELKKNE